MSWGNHCGCPNSAGEPRAIAARLTMPNAMAMADPIVRALAVWPKEETRAIMPMVSTPMPPTVNAWMGKLRRNKQEPASRLSRQSQ